MFQNTGSGTRNASLTGTRYSSTWNGLNRPRREDRDSFTVRTFHHFFSSSLSLSALAADKIGVLHHQTSGGFSIFLLILSSFSVSTLGLIQPSASVGNTYRVQEGDSVQLPCTIGDRPEYSSFSWSLDGRPLVTRQASSGRMINISTSSTDPLATYTTNWSNGKVSLGVDGSLLIESVRVEDSGEYKCAVIEGKRTRNVTQSLVVEVGKPSLQHADTNIVLTEGSTLSLQCSGLFPLEWDYPRQGGSHLQITNQLKPPVNGSLLMSTWRETSVLTVINITVETSGEYRCSHRATYEFSEVKWAATRVFVTQEKNQIFLPHLDARITVYPGQQFFVPCRSYPNHTITLRPAGGFWENKEERKARRSYLDQLPYSHHVGFRVDAYPLWFGDAVKCFAEGEEMVFNLSVVDSPMINIMSDVILKEGRPLDLVCTGLLRILWSFPVVDAAPMPTIRSSMDGTTDTFSSHLTVSSVSSGNSGRYSCFYSRFRPAISEELQTSTYVFVTNDRGEDFLPVPQGEETIRISEDSKDSFIIPCRLNNPNRTVRLSLCYKNQQQCPDHILNGYNYSYDERTGFHLDDISDSGDTTKINLQAHCFTKNDSQIFDLFFEGGENNGLYIGVTATSTKVFSEGTELNVTCRVDIFKFLLLDSTLRPQLVWEFPAKENATYLIEEDEDSSPRKRFIYYSRLTVFSVAPMTGELTFTCLSWNTMFRNRGSITVDVYDEAFIHIQNRNAENQTFFQPLQGDRVCLHVTITSFPAMMVEWYHDGTPLGPAHGCNATDEGGLYNRTCTHCFTPYYQWMGGDYTINVRNDYREDNLTFTVDVLVPPSIKIDLEDVHVTMPYEGAAPLYEEGTLNVFRCIADGNPTPIVHWEYSECASLASENDQCLPEGRETSGFSKNGQYMLYINSKFTPEEGSKELKVGAEVSAIFKCVATSNSTRFSQPMAEASMRFLVTYEKEPFYFSVALVFVNETARMDCVFNEFSYRETMIGYRINGTGEIVPIDQHRDARVTVTQHFELYNQRKLTVQIRQTQLEDQGTYYCVATPTVEGVPLQIAEADLVVKEYTPVRIQCASYNITHDVNGDDFPVSCAVSGHPMPQFQWIFPSQPSLDQKSDSVSSWLNIINGTATWANLTIPVSYFSLGQQREVIVRGTNAGSESYATIVVSGVSGPSIQGADEIAYSTYEAGQNFSLGCSAEGYPAPLIAWKKRAPSNFVSRVESSRMTIINGVFSVYLAEVTDSGVFICTASNQYGYHQKLFNITVIPDQRPEEGFPVYIIFVAISVIVSFIAIFVCISQRGHSKGNDPPLTLSELNDFNRGGMYPLHMQGMMPEEIYERLPYDIRWEFNRDRLVLGPVIGRGAFGMVIKAKAVGIEDISRSSIVAVKTLKDSSSDTEKKALWAELKLLAHVGRHLNVVNFLGACTTGSPLLLIVEFCTYGNLSEYLRKRRRVFYGSRDNTGGSDSSQMSFPNLSNESHLQTVRESIDESSASYHLSSTGGTCDSAIGNSTTDSPLAHRPATTLSPNSPISIKDKSHSSVDLTINGGGSLPRRKRLEKSADNDSGGQREILRDLKRSGLVSASSMGSLHRNILNQTRNTHAPLFFEDSAGSAFELPLREEDLICYSFQTSRGMEFLSSKQVIHRDLAARNVLLTEGNVVKICDFGLARHLYHNPDYVASGKGRFPVKWMAPESIFDKVYTTQSDIWSFGVLLWEIFSLGGSPYPGLQIDENFYTKLKEGYRMSPPEVAPQEMGELMLECWDENPKERPPFSELENRLGDLLAASTRMEYIEMNNPYEDMTAELEAQQQEHLKETSLLLPADSFESLCESPPTPSVSDTDSEHSLEVPSLSDLHQTTIV